MTQPNYYEVLGVDRSASAADIKKAYRKLVRQYHPDVSTDPDADEKTSQLNLAYNTLKDEEKRAEYNAMLDNPYAHAQQQGHGQQGYDYGGYDNGQPFRHEHFGQQGPFGSGDFRFDDIFSAFGSSARGAYERPASGPMAGEDQHAELSIDISAAYHGAERSLSLDMPTLDEQGRMSYSRKTLNVKIPKGISEGQQIRLAKQGLPGFNGGAAGDLYLKIRFHADEHLHVENRKDVYQTVQVAPWQAALGEKINVATPNGTLAVNLPANSRAGQKIRLKGRGIPAKEAGDLYLVLSMVLPGCHTDADKAAWQVLSAHYAGFNPGTQA